MCRLPQRSLVDAGVRALDAHGAWRQRWLASAPRQALGRSRRLCCSAVHTAVDVLEVDLSEDAGTALDGTLAGARFDLMQQRLRVGGRDVTLIVPRDVDAVMQMYIDAGQEDRDPYWTRPWPSAVALAAALLERPELVAGKSIADVGAGLGLAGIAAALAGANDVVLLDREPLALQCALLSAAASGVPVHSQSWEHFCTDGAAATASAALQGAPGGDIREVDPRADTASDARPARLAGGDSSRHGSAGSEGLIRAEFFDWTVPYAGPKFDVLLACDVLYEDVSVDPVAEAVPRMLFSSGGRLVLADPALRTQHNRAAFIELVGRGKTGLGLEEDVERLVAFGGAAELAGGGPVTPIRLMHFSRRWTTGSVSPLLGASRTA